MENRPNATVLAASLTVQELRDLRDTLRVANHPETLVVEHAIYLRQEADADNAYQAAVAKVMGVTRG